MRYYTLFALLPLVLGNTDCSGTAPAAAATVPTEFDGASEPSYTDRPQDLCFPIRPLVCGETVYDDTDDVNAGTTDVIDGWPGAIGNYSGPELSYMFSAEASGSVTFALPDAAPTVVNHDLFVLDADLSCHPDAVIATGFNTVTVEVQAGRDYYVVIDGFDGDAGPVTTQVTCEDDAIAPPYPDYDWPASDEAEECAFGEDASETASADWLSWDEMVEQHLTPESMSPLRQEQLRTGWTEATLVQDPVDVPFGIVGPEGVWVDELTLEATGERFDWMRFRQNGELPWSFIFRAGTSELVAFELDVGWMTCTLERP